MHGRFRTAAICPTYDAMSFFLRAFRSARSSSSSAAGPPAEDAQAVREEVRLRRNRGKKSNCSRTNARPRRLSAASFHAATHSPNRLNGVVAHAGSPLEAS